MFAMVRCPTEEGTSVLTLAPCGRSPRTAALFGRWLKHQKGLYGGDDRKGIVDAERLEREALLHTVGDCPHDDARVHWLRPGEARAWWGSASTVYDSPMPSPAAGRHDASR